MPGSDAWFIKAFGTTHTRTRSARNRESGSGFGVVGVRVYPEPTNNKNPKQLNTGFSALKPNLPHSAVNSSDHQPEL